MLFTEAPLIHSYSPFTAYLRMGNAVSFFFCFSVFSDACALDTPGLHLHFWSTLATCHW